MEYIPKSEIARLLYCLNWHTMDLISAVNDQANGMAAHERLALQDEINALRKLKTQVLRKLVREGHACICGVDASFSRDGVTRYYRIKINSRYGFHVPKLGFKESMNADE